MKLFYGPIFSEASNRVFVSDASIWSVSIYIYIYEWTFTCCIQSVDQWSQNVSEAYTAGFDISSVLTQQLTKDRFKYQFNT